MKHRDKEKEELGAEIEALRARDAKLEESLPGGPDEVELRQGGEEAFRAFFEQSRQAKEALCESEERYRTIADFTYDWEYWIDTDGRFLYVSPSCERITGYSANDFINDPSLIERIVHPSDRPALMEHMLHRTAEEAGDVCHLDFRILRRDGRLRWINHYCQPVFGTKGQRLGRRGSNRDITERKQAEAFILAQRDLSMGLSAVSDLHEALTMCIESALQVSGMDSAAIYLARRGSGFHLAAHKGIPEEIVEEISYFPADSPGGRLIRKGAPVYSTFDEVASRVGSTVQIEGVRAIAVIPIVHDGGTIGCFAIASSRMEAVPDRNRHPLEAIAGQIGSAIARIAAQEELRRHSTMLQALNKAQNDFLSSTPPQDLFQALLESLLSLTDSRYGYIGEVFYSGKGVPHQISRAITTVASDDEIRIYCQDQRHEGLRFEAKHGLFGAVLQTAAPVISNDPGNDPRSGGLPEGHPPINSFLGLPLHARDKFVGTVGVANRPGGYSDEIVAFLQPFLTTCANIIAALSNEQRRKHAEEMLIERTEALERSNRDLEQFAYIAAHDLREPLIAVAAYLKLVERRYQGALDAESERFVNRAIEATLRMDKLIQSLLSYSRLGSDALPLEPVDCNAILDRALSNLQSLMEARGVKLSRDPLPTLSAYPSQLLQLFQNLISNAIKFCGDRQPQIHVGATRVDGGYRFWVKDNGIGIESRHFEMIFRIFQRIDTGSDSPGAGIGLANCKKIVERHGGRIWVESEPGVGSTFFFTLPERRVGLR